MINIPEMLINPSRLFFMGQRDNTVDEALSLHLAS